MLIDCVMQKILLNEKFNAGTFEDKSSILDIADIADDLIINYFETVRNVYFVIDPEVYNSEPRHMYTYDSPTDSVIYFTLNISTSEEWERVSNSNEMKEFIKAKEELYSALGWIDQGYKIIEKMPDNLSINNAGLKIIPNVETAENIWNNSENVL